MPKNTQETGSVLPTLTPPKLFIAKGTEPFWSLEQTFTGAKFSEPGTEAVIETWYKTTQTLSGNIILVNGVAQY